MNLLDQARQALQAQKEAEAQAEEERLARWRKLNGQVKAWLDELVRASKVSVRVEWASGAWQVLVCSRDCYFITTRVDSARGVAEYRFREGFSGSGGTAVTLEKIQQTVCERVALAEWDQAQAIAKKLAGTPPVTT